PRSRTRGPRGAPPPPCPKNTPARPTPSRGCSPASPPFWRTFPYSSLRRNQRASWSAALEEGQPAVEIGEHRWAISDAPTLGSWLRANGVSEDVMVVFLR